MAAVWEFKLDEKSRRVRVPAGARALYVAMRENDPVIYFLVNPENSLVPRRVRVVRTGEVFDAGDAEPAGLLVKGGWPPATIHVFVWPEVQP